MIRTVINIVFDPIKRFHFLDNLGFYSGLSDEEYLKKYFRIREGKKLNLNDPKTLNEKLQYLKLYNRKEEYSKMVDKVEAKKYVAEIIGEKYIIPTYGVWNDFDDISFDQLPDKFILKCTHDSGRVFICNGKSKFDFKEAKKNISARLKINYYKYGREWVYKDVKPRIIAEKLLTNKDNSPVIDYKFYCYGGKPIYFMYSVGEADHNVKNHKFDMNLKSIDQLFKKQVAIAETDIVLPDNMSEMIELVKKLCVGFPHIRVDLYNVDGKIYFGELTFYTSSGFIHIDSEEYSDYLASLIDLSEIKREKDKI